ncbi:uncharacterized protein cenpu [Nelusetta ayraudi]|uniref:uncharacterized protein cenpu n=1 Tax=Nelusetta ayraudi TaxID=303726 RepID=UPI003F72804D
MSSKGGRGAKVAHKAKQTPSHGKDELSSIATASFLEGLQCNNGHPLHSTALEEDLQASEAEGAKTAEVGKKAGVQRMKEPAVKRQGASAKRKKGPEGEEEEEEEKEKENAGKRRKRSVKEKDKPSPEEVKQTKKGKKAQSRPQSGKPRSSQAQEDGLDTGATRQRRRSLPSSDDELGDDDKSWNPSSKKSKMLGSSKKLSTSGEPSREIKSGGAGKAQTGEPMRKRRRHKATTELDVVLDAFLDFSNEYRESVESEAIKRSIGTFVSSVEEQLEEQISSYKELSALKRESNKNASQTRTKSKTLLEAKYELMRAKRKQQHLHKERAALKLRLADLRRGHAFLQDIRGLQGQYLDFRRGHPKEKETYGASSLPALMLEAKHVQSTEQQLRGINARLENRLKKEGK